MKNKRGFTLVELLAAIIIISVLALLTTNAITGVVKDGKQDLYDNQLILIEKAAKQWFSENMKDAPYATEDRKKVVSYLLLSDLQESGILNKDIKNPKTGENFADSDAVIKITSAYKAKHDKYITEYEIITDNEQIELTLSEAYHATEELPKLSTLMIGEDFNVAIKNLANNSTSLNSWYTDTAIISIGFYSNGSLPTGYTLDQLQALPSANVSHIEGEVIAYNDNGKIYVYSENLISFNEDCSNMFFRCDSLSNVEFVDVYTSNVTNMCYMFAHCNSLIELDVSKLDVSNVADMSDMFLSCNLNEIYGINEWDTSNVTNMASMFSGCTSLSSLDVSDWDTSSLSYTYSMFSYCHSLITIDVTNWDVSNVTDMSEMFDGCTSLSSLDVSNWDTSSLSYTYSMFSGCTSLSSLDVTNWDVSNLREYYGMFYTSDDSLKNGIDVSNWQGINTSMLFAGGE